MTPAAKLAAGATAAVPPPPISSEPTTTRYRPASPPARTSLRRMIRTENTPTDA